MPGTVSPPPKQPGAKWPGFLINRSGLVRLQSAGRHDNQHCDILLNDTQHNNKVRWLRLESFL